jgi:hypothetical protein
MIASEVAAFAVHRGPGIKAYVREYLLDGGALKDRRNDRKRSAAVRAMLEIQVKHPLQ